MRDDNNIDLVNNIEFVNTMDNSIPGHEVMKLEAITTEFISEAVTSKKAPDEWLKKKLKKSKVNDHKATAELIFSTVRTCEKNLDEIEQAKEEGFTGEDWLEDKIISSGVANNDKELDDLNKIDDAVKELNDKALGNIDSGALEVMHFDPPAAAAPKKSNKHTGFKKAGNLSNVANRTSDIVVGTQQAAKIATFASSMCKNIGISAAIGAVCRGSSKYSEIQQQRLAGKEVEHAVSQIVTEAVKGASSSALTVAVAGAIKYAAENGIVSVLPKDLSASACANIAFAAIEHAKIAYKTAKGELTASQAIGKAADVTLAAVGGFIGAKFGSKGGGFLGTQIGGLIGSVFGPVGTAVGAAVGGTVGSVCGTIVGKSAGVKVSQMVSYGRQKIGQAASALIRGASHALSNVTNIFRKKEAMLV